MLSVRPVRLINLDLVLQKRFKQKLHWAKARRKVGPTHKAIQHFDEFYGNVFGKLWEPTRTALFRRQKYVALVNNYGDPEETCSYLQNRGAHDFQKLLEVYKNTPKEDNDQASIQKNHYNTDASIENIYQEAKMHDLDEIYPNSESIPHKEEQEIRIKDNKALTVPDGETLAHQSSLAKSLNTAEIDESRLIDPDIELSSNSLWQYIPATKLMGKEDWIPPSQHYSYYEKGKDFPLTIEPEDVLLFPEHLKVYTFESENLSKFPEPKRSLTGVYNYYPMDGGSILPVLALGIEKGDRILDLCSAPGGKALVALQTLYPDIVICNDESTSRTNRIKRVFRDYLCDYETSNKWQERTMVTRVDGRFFKDEQLFDKVLVDVPCTTDRHSVKEDDNNIFRADRIKERLKIPELQAALLVNALSLVKVGGTVVYSTCTFSPIQNDGVVHLALKMAFEQIGVRAIIRDLSNAVIPYYGIYKFGQRKMAPKYGQLVVPDIAANFGPSYFAKMTRIA